MHAKCLLGGDEGCCPPLGETEVPGPRLSSYRTALGCLCGSSQWWSNINNTKGYKSHKFDITRILTG